MVVVVSVRVTCIFRRVFAAVQKRLKVNTKYLSVRAVIVDGRTYTHTDLPSSTEEWSHV